MNSPLYLHHLCVEFYSTKIKEAERRANKTGNPPLDRYHDEGARDYFAYLENAIHETYWEVVGPHSPDLLSCSAAIAELHEFLRERNRTTENTERFLASAQARLQRTLEQQQERGLTHGSHGMKQDVQS